MNPVVHFEIPYDDKNRAAEFYKNAFGWQPNMLGPEMNNYVTVQTGPTDAVTMRPTEPGHINGGLYARAKNAEHPSVVISVDDIHAAMKKVQEAGGTLIDGKVPGVPEEIPGVGLFMGIVDSEGNHISLLQPKM